MTEYQNFDVWVTPDAITFQAPMRAARLRAEVRKRLRDKAPAAAVWQTPTDVGSEWLPDESGLLQLGTELCSFLFEAETERAFQEASASAQTRGLGCRIRLGFDPDLPELDRLPWELMAIQSRTPGPFLALDPKMVIVRSIRAPASRTLTVDGQPLRLLGVSAITYDRPLLDPENVWRMLERSNPKLLSFTRMDGATWDRFTDALSSNSGYHAVHLLLDASAQPAGLVFQTESSEAHPCPVDEVAKELAARKVRLVVLDNGGADVTARAFVQAGIPAVVSWQHTPTLRESAIFAQVFYLALCDRYPIDAGLGELRRKLYYERHLAWWAPVLHLTAPDGALFGQQADWKISGRVTGGTISNIGSVEIGGSSAGRDIISVTNPTVPGSPGFSGRPQHERRIQPDLMAARQMMEILEEVMANDPALTPTQRVQGMILLKDLHEALSDPDPEPRRLEQLRQQLVQLSPRAREQTEARWRRVLGAG